MFDRWFHTTAVGAPNHASTRSMAAAKDSGRANSPSRGGQPDERQPCDPREAHGVLSGQGRIQPATGHVVMVGVGVHRVQQHVGIDQFHDPSRIRRISSSFSRSALTERARSWLVVLRPMEAGLRAELLAVRRCAGPLVDRVVECLLERDSSLRHIPPNQLLGAGVTVNGAPVATLNPARQRSYRSTQWPP